MTNIKESFEKYSTYQAELDAIVDDFKVAIHRWRLKYGLDNMGVFAHIPVKWSTPPSGDTHKCEFDLAKFTCYPSMYLLFSGEELTMMEKLADIMDGLRPQRPSDEADNA